MGLKAREQAKVFLVKSPWFSQAVGSWPLKGKAFDSSATHVVPLVEVHRAGDGGEALIAVMVVRMQGGGYAKMTSGR